MHTTVKNYRGKPGSQCPSFPSLVAYALVAFASTFYHLLSQCKPAQEPQSN